MSQAAHDEVLAEFDAWSSRCEESEYTDTGVAWHFLNALAGALRAKGNPILTITPESLREIADDLEREGTNFCRTVTADDGTLIDIAPPEEAFNLPEALTRAEQYLAAAREALADEHEGGAKRALQGLRAVSDDMADLVENW